MKRGMVIFLKVAVVVIGIVVGSLCAFALPPLATHTAELYPEFAYLHYPVLLGLYATVIPFFFALIQAWRLLKNIEINHAFSTLSISALGRIKYCAGIIGTFYVIGMIALMTQSALHPGIAIIGLVILFSSIVIMLFTAVLQQLLNGVVQMKTENDLTI
ncbi:DUF2975 domain-containing protein [Pontibacillus litoralis]|uniref:Membrane protein n=1 Tax=Pontibacillus litoralis JSM 072002 TaxID=1385512 RepID=A0A0A5G515_9BACI|nr:DUF2975 domain-containing protein [Pontibacillus litoralis]KGX88216.1 membrane protein [Pontibacillus litoralis JSM 072002]